MIPVVAVSASASAEDRPKIIAAGFDGFHGKPISMKELLETIRHVLDRLTPR